MYGYKIKQDNGKYYFKLYPGNKPNQYIGESRRYNKKEDCEKALKEFRNFVKDNNLNSFIEGKMKLSKKLDKRNSIQYIIRDDIVFETRPYGSKENRDTGISSIFNHIDEYTTQIYILNNIN